MKTKLNLLQFLLAGLLIEAHKKKEEFNLNFQQHDYQLKFERAELVRYNSDYVKNIAIVNRKYNRTTPIINFTFTLNIDVGYDMEIITQAYKFMSNEYRLFPIHFGCNFCIALAANVAGLNTFTSCGNFTGCPFLKGRVYHICNFYPDQSKFPPFIPSCEYKVEFQLLHSSKELYVFNAYGSVTRPIVIN